MQVNVLCVGGYMKTLKSESSSFYFKAIVLAALLVGLPASAAPLLNGVSVYSELGSEKFIAGLYSSSLSKSSKNILEEAGEKTIEVRVVDERLSSRRFKRMWIEGIAINSSTTELENHAQNMADFSNLLKVKLKRGDIFKVEKLPENVRISVNEIALGEIENTEFFDLLLRTWIGFVPLSSEFRDGLLAEGAVPSPLLSRFEQIQPSPERVAILEQAIINKQEQEAEEQEQVASVEEKKPARISLPPEKIQVAVAAPTVKPSVSAPAVAEQKPVQKPKVEKVAAAKPKTLPAPTQISLPPAQEELDESIFDDEEADVELTAEGLLIQQLYYSRLANYTQNFARYPRIAQERGREGSLLIRVTIDREGKVLDTEFIEETESYSLNKEAKRAVKRASPFPPIPTEIIGQEFSFMFRLTFSLADRSETKLTRLASR